MSVIPRVELKHVNKSFVPSPGWDESRVTRSNEARYHTGNSTSLTVLLENSLICSHSDIPVPTPYPYCIY